MTTTTKTNEIETEVSKQDTEPKFGNGRYSESTTKLYWDLRNLLKIETAKAEKIARNCASDCAAFLKDQKVSLKVGSWNKNDKGSIGEIVQNYKSAHFTGPMKLAHVIGWIGEAGKHGVSFGFTEWRLDDNLQQYVDNLTV